ncbi:MAG: DNA primase small subunit domain-containing protein [Nitrososphaera sp.]
MSKSADVARVAFRQYYFNQRAIEAPDGIEQREFAYAHFGMHGMVRHLSFRNMGELVATLVKEVPSDVYCSNALYRFPTLAMQEKQWLGADLIFDIDGKDLDLPCVPSHSYSVCSACSHVSAPEDKEYACQSCGGKKAEYLSIPCAKCIDGSKKEAKALIDLMTHDLGIGRQSIRMYFSGNNGFHFHVHDDAYRPLDSQARADLVGYLTGVGLMAESIGVRKSQQRGDDDMAFVKFPRSGLSLGWRKKVAGRLKIDTSSTLRLTNIVKEKGGYTGFKADLDKMTREMGVRIDPQVTTDVHRVFRMPGTINSKSGLAKVRCDIDDIDSFDPFKQSCVLGDNKVKVKVKAPVRLKLKGEPFNISKESAELPAFAAVYLICKGLAEAA